ncbi:MAG: RNA-binding domain-containing protein [Planctomycetota bacterium]
MEMERDIQRWSKTEEGPFFERKSAIDRSSNRVRPRKAADLAHDIAETLSAMANADGGELVIGLENDGAMSGVPHPADSRCLLRVGSSNQPFDKDKIKALKDAKHQGLFERTFPAGSRIEDLDNDLLARFAEKAGPETAVRDALSRLRLIEGRNDHAVPTLAALLLFGRDPLRWHDRCGIDFVRWEGVERKSGAKLNISKRFRIEAPLAVLLDKAFEAIKDMIRKGIVRSPKKGSRIYEVKEPWLVLPDMPSELALLLPVLQRKSILTNADVRETLGLTKITSGRLLRELVASQWLAGTGKRGIGARYSAGSRLLYQSQTIHRTAEADTLAIETDTMKPSRTV